MIYHLLSFIIAPILILQGLYVRRVTPKLPEPDGPRSGAVGTGPKTRVLILGDSAAAGVGVDTQDKALSGRLVETLCKTHEVVWKLLASTGDDSKDILTLLQSVKKESFDSVIVSVGVNDVTSQTRLDVWERNLQSIIDILKEKFNAQFIYLTCLPPMHLFPALPQPIRWWLGIRAKRLNTILEGVIESNQKCVLVRVPLSFDKGSVEYVEENKDILAEDGFHPGESTYRLWGTHVAQLIQSEDIPDH